MVWVTAFVFLIYFTLFHTVWVQFSGVFGERHAILVLVLSIPLGLWLRRERGARELVVVGSALVVLHGIGMSISQYLYTPPMELPTSQISWVCVFILLLPFLVPGRPAHVGVVALVAAFTDPLGFWIAATWLDANVPPTDVLGSFMLPPFVTALIAWKLSDAMFVLNREVSKARRLGAYELTERLGAGGMGEVWKASHRLLARPAAVKLIRSESQGEGMAIERFEREAQATASLESPHTVELYDFGVAEDGTLFYVMELLRGVDLETLVRNHGSLPPERVAHLLLQACESLHEAHERGMIHRDVKPANLFVCRKGPRTDYLKVLDFGLVKGSGRDDDPNRTQENQITGTPAYLSPEALRGRPPVSGRSDVYALGCVTFFLLTGRTVFEGETTVAIASAHLHEEPKAPSTHAPNVPPGFDALVLAMLAKDPTDRPDDAEVAERLLALELEPWTQERSHAWWAKNLADV